MKYYDVILALDQDTSTRMLDVIWNPPERGFYDNLKSSFMKAFSLTRTERAAKILDLNGLEKRKPSPLLFELKPLADNQSSCLFFG